MHVYMMIHIIIQSPKKQKYKQIEIKIDNKVCMRMSGWIDFEQIFKWFEKNDSEKIILLDMILCMCLFLCDC